MGDAVKRVDRIKYDGNGGAVIAWVEARVALGEGFSGWAIDTLTEDAGVITLVASNNSFDFVLSEGEWLTWEAFGFQVLPEAIHNLYFRELPAAVSGTAAGVEDVPALLLGANTNVVVPLSRAMADDDYDVTVDLIGANGTLTVNTVTKATDQVTVNVSTGLAYVSGAQVHVVAHGNVA